MTGSHHCLPLEGVRRLSLRFLASAECGSSGAIEVLLRSGHRSGSVLELSSSDPNLADVESLPGTDSLAVTVRNRTGEDCLVMVGIPPGLKAVALEVTRGSVEASRLPCQRLSVLVRRGDVTLRGLEGFVVASVGRGTIRMDGLAAEILGTVGTGSLSVTGCAGTLRLHTAEGCLTVTDFSGPAAKLICDNGSIEAERVVADQLTLEGNDLKARLDSVATRCLSLSATAAEMSMCGELGDGQHRLIAERGSISLTIPRVAPVKFDLSTGSGSLRSAFPGIDVGRRGRPSHRGRRLVGRHLSGTAEIEVSLGTGDVYLATLPEAQERVDPTQHAGRPVRREGEQ